SLIKTLNTTFIAHPYVLLGGKRMLDGMKLFRWNDGTDLVFTNWAKRFPETYKGVHCIKMDQRGLWFTATCKRSYPVFEFCQIVFENEDK
ncbi:hypothetical protein B4U80_14753, partial [Leptotrombidium deliense]